MNVFDLETFYEGIGSTTTYSDAVDYVETNFSGLAYTTMSTFADTARLIILNSIGSTAGTAVTGVVSFGLLNNPVVTLGLTPFTFDFTLRQEYNMLHILADLANELDNNQAHRLADKITSLMKTANDDYDHEYDMVRNQMETAERAIEGIEDVIGDEGEGNLMAWVQSKITNAVDMLDGVSDYLQSQHKTASDKNKGKKLNKPFRTPGGPKKFSVYVKNDKGNIVKVNFGDPGLSIKRDNPNRRKNFRARHNCDNPGPKWKARYWSCRNWEAGRSVSR